MPAPDITWAGDIVISGEDTQTLPYSDSIAFTRKLSDTSDWNVAVNDDERELNPIQPSGPWAGVLNGKAYGTDGMSYAKRFQLSGTQNGSPWRMPDGIPDVGGHELEQGNPDEKLTWQGKGIAAKLFKPRLSLPTIISTMASKKYVQDCLAIIFEAMDVPYDVSGVEPNYLVARMTMADGQPIEWIRQLLEVTQGEWYEDVIDGVSTIVCFQPDWATSSYDRSFTTEEVGLRKWKASDSAVLNFANYITLQRADDTGGVIATASGKNETFGRQSRVTFSSPVPLSSLSWKKKLKDVGETSDFYIYDADDHIIDERELRGAAPPVVGGSTMAASVDFTLGAAPWTPLGTTQGSYYIEFIADTTGGIYADSTTALVAKNDASIASGLGRVQDKLGPNPIIADETTLQIWGDRTVYKRSREQVRREGTIFPADYGLRPGHRVRVIDAQFSKTYILTVLEVPQLWVPEPNQLETVFRGIQYV